MSLGDWATVSLRDWATVSLGDWATVSLGDWAIVSLGDWAIVSLGDWGYCDDSRSLGNCDFGNCLGQVKRWQNLNGSISAKSKYS